MNNACREYLFGDEDQKLFVQEWGHESKPAIFFVHGFPGCGEQGQLLTTTPHMDSFRLICFDRPGYGRSHFQRNLTPLALASQIVRLADQLQIRKFKILSVSGGAPYAMALAFLLGTRVEKISSVAGVAPLTVANFKFMNSNQKKAWILRNLVPAPVLKYGMNRVWKSGLDKVDQFLFSELKDFSPPDQTVFRHPVIGPALVKTVKTGLSAGPSGVLHDMKVYSKPWGFALNEIKCPVTFWHGDVDDVVHIRFTKDMQKRIPHSKVNLIANEGHYSLPMNYRDQIIQELLS